MTEEEEGLPEFASKCTTEELMQLRRDFDAAIVPTHPHPLAPRRGLPAKIAAVCARPIDLLRDAVNGCIQGQCGRGRGGAAAKGAKGAAAEEEEQKAPLPVPTSRRNVAVPTMRKHKQPTSIVEERKSATE